MIGNGLPDLPHLRGWRVCAGSALREVPRLRRGHGATEIGPREADSTEADATACKSMRFPPAMADRRNVALLGAMGSPGHPTRDHLSLGWGFPSSSTPAQSPFVPCRQSSCGHQSRGTGETATTLYVFIRPFSSVRTPRHGSTVLPRVTS